MQWNAVVGVVDPRRQRLDGDVGHLHDPELHVLLGRALRPQQERLADVPANRLVGRVWRRHRRQRLAGEDEVAYVRLHRDHQPPGLPQLEEAAPVHGLQVPGGIRRHGNGRPARGTGIGRLGVVRMAYRLGKEPVHVAERPAGHAGSGWRRPGWSGPSG
jgi:hypothetical protein